MREKSDEKEESFEMIDVWQEWGATREKRGLKFNKRWVKSAELQETSDERQERRNVWKTPHQGNDDLHSLSPPYTTIIHPGVTLLSWAYVWTTTSWSIPSSWTTWWLIRQMATRWFGSPSSTFSRKVASLWLIWLKAESSNGKDTHTSIGKLVYLRVNGSCQAKSGLLSGWICIPLVVLTQHFLIQSIRTKRHSMSIWWKSE